MSIIECTDDMQRTKRKEKIKRSLDKKEIDSRMIDLNGTLLRITININGFNATLKIRDSQIK